MAKTAKPKSKVMLAADAGRKALADAKERFAKSATDQNKKAIDHAAEALKPLIKAENRERFIDVGGGRIGKAISVIETLRQVANRRTYEYSAEDINKAMAAIRSKIDEIGTVFDTALKTTPTVEKKAAPKAFSFE